jgi:WD40 repeat protein
MNNKSIGILGIGLILAGYLFCGLSSGQPEESTPTPAIIVNVPNGGNAWAPGTAQTISWRYDGIRAEEIVGPVKIELFKGGRWHSNITLDAPPGTGTGGSYIWEIPLFHSQGNNFRVRLTASRRVPEDPLAFAAMTDDSDGDFAIPGSGRIAFASISSGSTTADIYVRDEGGMRQLTRDPADDLSPAWSPQWAKIAFVSRRDRNFEIYTMNADGTVILRLTSNSADDKDPAWSPDGTKICFSSNRDGNDEIYLMKADGTEQRRLTTNSADDKLPAWSPDGTKIAFVSGRDGDYEIYVMNADGSEQRRLTTMLEADFEPAWSPDGTKIAFSSSRDGSYHIYLMNADGTNQRRLTTGFAEEKHPTWSPDGTRIAFYSKTEGNFEIYAVSLDGSHLTNLTNRSNADWDPAWTPRRRMRLEPTRIDPKRLKTKIKRD